MGGESRAGRHKGKGVGAAAGFISSLAYSPMTVRVVAILTNSYSSVGQVIEPDVAAIAFRTDCISSAHRLCTPSVPAHWRRHGRFQMPPDFYTPNSCSTFRTAATISRRTSPNGSTNIVYPAAVTISLIGRSGPSWSLCGTPAAP